MTPLLLPFWYLKVPSKGAVLCKFIKLQTVGNAAKLSEMWKESMLNTKGGMGLKKLVKLTINIFQLVHSCCL